MESMTGSTSHWRKHSEGTGRVQGHKSRGGRWLAASLPGHWLDSPVGQNCGAGPTGMARWSWRNWGEGSGTELRGGALPGPAGPPPPARAAPPLPWARGAAASTPLARPRSPGVSLTHGLRHLQLLVEPLAQDLRHGWAWASDSAQGNQAHRFASSCCQGQPVAKEASPGGAQRKARRRGATEPRLGGRKSWPAPFWRV